MESMGDSPGRQVELILLNSSNMSFLASAVAESIVS